MLKWIVALWVLLPMSAAADGILDVLERPTVPFNQRNTFFPNWVAVPTASFIIQECQDAICTLCPSSTILSLTVLNYGSATNADISNVYFRIICGTKNDSGMLTMVPKGFYTYGAVSYAAWTWEGEYLFAANKDPCDDPDTGCSCEVSLFLYADISPCPADGATVQLGLPVGGLVDDCDLSGPWTEAKDSSIKEIHYVAKTVDKSEAAPGDTLTYTIYVGKPGTVPTQTVVMDTIPDYMHLVSGSAIPGADLGYDPDMGPPMRIRWTLPSTTLISGGTTSAITFKATVDWGNDTDPQAGDAGAPEGARLWNTAQGFWPASDCGTKTYVSQPVRTVASRFLFWKIGNNDILFAGDPEQREDDYMTYEIFVKNKSSTKIWWDVTIWDTVPADLDPWWAGCGIDDDCIGFTMTPTGCARGAAGRVVTGFTTVLTWRLDLPPGGTLALKWRGRVRLTASAGSVVHNQAAVRAYGKPWVYDSGTGDSQVPATFTHQAIVVLRTTYFSYTSFAASTNYSESPGFFIVFFPLNVQANFQLWKLEYTGGTGVAGIGGKTETIDTFVQSCENMNLADGGGFSVAGCGLDRRPAFYWPFIWDGIAPPMQFIFFYKVTSNSPFLWMVMTEIESVDQDALTYLPSSSLTYRGFMHYTVCRVVHEALNVPGRGDRLVIINTNMDFNNAYRDDLPTNIHIFKWNWGIPFGWNYLQSGVLDSESAWMPFEGTYGAYKEDNSIYRIVSSDSQNIIYQGDHTYGAPPDISGAFDNHGGIAPNRENGLLVSTPGETANFYAVCYPNFTKLTNCVIGNMGDVDATYRIWQYMPRNTAVPDANWPTTLAGSSGFYILKATHVVPAGFGAAGNPRMYGTASGDSTMTNSAGFATLWKIELINGGPIQVHAGGNIYEKFAGASNVHASDGHAAGMDFWFFQGPPTYTGCNDSAQTFVINTFSPKKGVGVRLRSTEYANAVYSTDGPDQAIVWMPFTTLSEPVTYRIRVEPTGVQGSLVTQYHQCIYTEKFLTAPFVETGVHYKIYAPAVAYSGQGFCLTVVVVGAGGGTQTDYCGTMEFTSSDSRAYFPDDPYAWKSVSCPANGTPYDDGIRIFVNVTLYGLGPQTIIGSDMADGSVTGLTSLVVVGAAVNLTKEPRLAISSSGDAVQFRICWSNYSSATAFDLTITDAVPMGTNLVSGVIADFVCGVKSGVTVDVAYSTATSVAAPAVFDTASSGVPGTARWLRWTVKHGGIMSTGCVCFRVSVL